MMGCYVWRFALMHTLFSPSVKQNLDLRTREPIDLMMISLSQFPNMARKWDVCHCQTNISGMVISLGTSSQYSYSSLINVIPINLHYLKISNQFKTPWYPNRPNQISSISQWNHPQIPSNPHQAITIYHIFPLNKGHIPWSSWRLTWQQHQHQPAPNPRRFGKFIKPRGASLHSETDSALLPLLLRVPLRCVRR